MLSTYLLYLIYLSVTIFCAAKPPNIVLFLLDDQDILINGMNALPKTTELFKANGIEFINAFASTPVCCVSRGSILSGRYVHNSQIFNNSIFGGCGSAAYIKNDEPYTYAAYLHKQANYRTFFSGKYLNLYGKTDQMPYTHVPQGWTDWYGLIGDAVYYDYRLSINGESREYHGFDTNDDYLPFVMHRKAKSFLNDMVDTNDDRPFLISLAFPSGHTPWTPSEEYMYVLDDATLKAPRLENFNYFHEDGTNKDKGPVLRQQSKMNQEQIAMADKVYRGRHGTFMVVDDIISDLHQQITEMGEIDNTYFIYTSDHGFHIGQFGMWFGKKLLYDTDLRIPFLISGPDINANTVTSKIAVTIDIAPTIVDLATGSVPDTMDGESLVPYFNLEDTEETEILNSRQEFVVEYYGETDIHHQLDIPYNDVIISCPSNTDDISEFPCDLWNNTYKCVRVIDGSKLIASIENDNIGEIFCKYTCFNDAYEEVECAENSVEAKGEYYNLDLDPYQLTNGYEQLSSNKVSYFESKLDAHLQCEGIQCREMRTIKREEDILKSHQQDFMVVEELGMRDKFVVTMSVLGGIFLILCIWTVVYFKYGCCASFCYKRNKKISMARFETYDRNEDTLYHYSPLQRAINTRYNTM